MDLYEEEKEREKARQKIQTENFLKGCGGCLVLFALIGGVIFVIHLLSPPSPKPAKVDHSPVEAWTVAQQFVERRLVSPGSAKYPWGYSDYVTHLGGGRYRISAYVDSQNRFGALIRTDFTCVVRHIQGDEWRLESLDTK